MQNGMFVVGQFETLESTPWKDNPERFNHRLVVSESYEDRFGKLQTNYTMIDISPDDLQVLQAQAPRITGKQVMVPVVCSARTGGRNGAWLSVRMPKGAKLIFPSQPAANDGKAA